MKIDFKSITLHNFLSFGHSEISLDNKGYCLVSGINRCPKDNAISNGSGKSTFISAICWVLTGETIQGITKDVKNIYIDEDSCYVTLKFKVDGVSYELTRYNKPKSDLKIIVNDEDKSGKGIRESELVLASYLPDLNKNLLSSVILLGQGLPNKLSSHTPSGRKEMLEQLSKSDFMIEDIKSRISDRLTALNDYIKALESDLIKHGTELSMHKQNLEYLIKTRDTSVCKNFDVLIENCNEVLVNTNKKIETLSASIEQLQINIDNNSTSLLKIIEEKQQSLNDEFNCYSSKRDTLVENKSGLSAKVSALSLEIQKLKDIKEVCPTCGRPFEGVVKPDTKQQEEELLQLKESLLESTNLVDNCNKKHLDYISEINNEFDKQIDGLKQTVNSYKSQLSMSNEELSKYIALKEDNEKEVIKLTSEKENEDKYKKELLSKISITQQSIDNFTQIIDIKTKEKEDLLKHLEVVKKMDTLVKRDFRGYLLSNVISFIDTKAKEYCSDVFGSNDINFKLDGNNIDITYCDKSFESLSGGEKQKVDIVLQFAIRDMMSKYLNFSSNILCLDEIFDNLDSKSTTSVLNLISNKLSDVESLFIISHHSDELSIPSDCELIIEKNEFGISEVK